MLNYVIRRDDVLDIFVLQLLVLFEWDAGGKIFVAVEVDNMDMDLSNVSDLVVMGKRNHVLSVGLTFLNGGNKYMNEMRFGIIESLSISLALWEPYLGNSLLVLERDEIGEVSDTVIVGNKADLNVLASIGSR